LRRGDVVLAGALTRMVPARPGDRFSAEFAHLGTVSVRFGAP
jgi:2-keto-4-pentenoate hydratase